MGILPWPDSPRALSGRLRRAATVLRTIGIRIDFVRSGRARTRVISITTAPEEMRASASSASSENTKAPDGGDGEAPESMRTDGEGSGASDGGVWAGAASTVWGGPNSGHGAE